MDAREFLKSFSEEAEKFAKRFFETQRKRAVKIDPVAVEAINELGKYIQGGKKARFALTILGYQLAGGKDIKKILPAAFAVELMHNSLVIHDDFIDHDTLRRGKPTVHTVYAKMHGEHYGASMAIVVADLGIFLANEILANLDFSPNARAKAISAFNGLLLNTGYGELMDIDFDFKKNISWQDIVRVRIYKTAHYTFVMPLVVGAILGGPPPQGSGEVKLQKLLELLKKYGEPVGLAFQIRDDILGIFGDSKETGKSTDSDIKEGKKTLLYFKALEFAGKMDKEFLKKWYGKTKTKSPASPAGGQVLKIKNIIKESGALEYSDKLAREYVAKAKKFIPKITSNPDLAQTLSSLADYMVEREK